jgi:hypothetical protein
MIQNGKQEIYSDGQQLLDDILRNKEFKHSQQLRFLANRHEGTHLKIRFVLNPFSFVFLLSGDQQFHIILKTLDTEEATYLWHTDKTRQSLTNKIKEIDQQLDIIRNKGRQVFLETNPDNFSRILHDYSDKRKGFIIWKNLLEEQIVTQLTKSGSFARHTKPIHKSQPCKRACLVPTLPGHTPPR